MEAGERKDWSTFRAVAKALGLGESVTSIVKTEGSSTDAAGSDRLYQLRQSLRLSLAPSYFTGRVAERAEMVRLLTADRADERAVKLHSVKAMGGMGKSTLAKKVVEEVRDHFPIGQLLIDMKGTTTPIPWTDAMATVIRLFRPEWKSPDTDDEYRTEYRRVLHVLKDRFLLVLDDAADAQQVQPLLADAPPTVGFIITSRNTISLPGVKTLDLQGLSEPDAISLLQKLAGDACTPEQFTIVARACVFLPLALVVAGAYLATHSRPGQVSAYLAALQQAPLDKLDSKLDEWKVRRVLRLSAIQLIEDSRELALGWEALSVFPGSFDAAAAAAVWELSEEEASEQIEELEDRSLLQYVSGGIDHPERYELHALLRPIAAAVFECVDEHPLQAGAEDRRNAAERRYVAFYARVLGTAEEMYVDKNRGVRAALALFDLETSNIRHGQAWARRHRETDPFAAEMCRNFALDGALTTSLRLAFLETVEWQTNAVEACRQLNDKAHEGMALGNLGIAWYSLGDARKAITFHEQRLTIAREIGDRHGEGNALGNLAMSWISLGDARKAIEFVEQDLAIRDELQDLRGKGVALGILGNAWISLGEYRKAIEFLDQCLAIARETGDRREEGGSLNNLGLAWQAIGDDRKAITFYEQRLEIAREIGDRRGEGITLSNLARVWYARNDIRKAIGLFEQHLVIAREIGDRYGEGNALGAIGAMCAALGSDTQAVDYIEQHLAIACEIGDRSGEASASFNMALSLDSLDRRAEAIPLAEQALAIFEAIESPYAQQVRQQLTEWRQSAN